MSKNWVAEEILSVECPECGSEPLIADQLNQEVKCLDCGHTMDFDDETL